jgi:hypothetical protein
VLGALQREHLRALVARDHHRIHFAAANGAERFLRFCQARAEPAQAIGSTIHETIDPSTIDSLAISHCPFPIAHFPSPIEP